MLVLAVFLLVAVDFVIIFMYTVVTATGEGLSATKVLYLENSREEEGVSQVACCMWQPHVAGGISC